MSITNQNPVASLNVQELLDNAPAARPGSSLVPMIIAIVVITALATAGVKAAWMQALMPAVLALIIVLTFMRASRMAGQQRQELGFLRQIDETIRLGQWDVAGLRLVQVLKSPVQRPHTRFQALIYLGSVLNHEERFAEVERVYDHLLQNAQLTPQIAFSLRCARAYAILREDRLTDAYEIINQLRHDPQGATVAMAGLLEMYRQVKTGHNDDVLELFEKQKQVLAQQLGHRSADGWALAATAAQGLGRTEQAGQFARNALLLGHKDEIVRRFPECAAVLEHPAPAPAPAAGASGEASVEGAGQ